MVHNRATKSQLICQLEVHSRFKATLHALVMCPAHHGWYDSFPPLCERPGSTERGVRPRSPSLPLDDCRCRGSSRTDRGRRSARGTGPGELPGDRHKRFDRHKWPSRHRRFSSQHRFSCHHRSISRSSYIREPELIWHIEPVGRCDKPASDGTCSQSESADGRVGWDFTLRRETALSLA